MALRAHKQPNDVQSLGAMLRYRRPAGSRTEKKFIKDHLLPLGVQYDGYGNLWKRIGDSPVLWSSHTDTVHRFAGKQRVLYSDGKFKVFDEQSNCLGADDTAGVWIMTQMMEAGVPGLYVFHRAEEVGGGGSEHFVKHNKETLKGIEFAIAFDRAGKESIITHQGWKRCCSEDFSASFAKELGMAHKSDDGGTFTDTANYVDDVGECTNLSVGYRGQHSKTEELDAKYLFELRDAMFDFNYKNLTSKRKAGETEWKYSSYGYGHESWYDDYYYGGGYQYPRGTNLHSRGSDVMNTNEGRFYKNGKGEWVHEDLWDPQDAIAGYINRNGVLVPVDANGTEVKGGKVIELKKNSTTGSKRELGADEESAGDQPVTTTGTSGAKGIHGGFERLVNLIKDNPREVADFMEESGVTADDLGFAIWQRGGVLRSSSSISTWRGHNIKDNK